MRATIKRYDGKIPCKFEHHFHDRVPVPFGKGDCDMPGFDCKFDGDEVLLPEIERQKECNPKCPGYQPLPLHICPIHNEEYIDCCNSCEEDAFKYR